MLGYQEKEPEPAGQERLAAEAERLRNRLSKKPLKRHANLQRNAAWSRRRLDLSKSALQLNRRLRRLRTRHW